MNVGPRCAVVLIATGLVLAATLGCHRQKPEAQVSPGLPLEAYETLKPKVVELQKLVADVHKGTDDIAAQIPGGQEFRAKVLATEEVLGVADAECGGWAESSKPPRPPQKRAGRSRTFRTISPRRPPIWRR